MAAGAREKESLVSAGERDVGCERSETEGRETHAERERERERERGREGGREGESGANVGQPGSRAGGWRRVRGVRVYLRGVVTRRHMNVKLPLAALVDDAELGRLPGGRRGRSAAAQRGRRGH